jgi:ABC-2 type transport system permease protein
MTSLRIALHGGVLAFRALFEWLSPVVFVTVMVLTPLLQVLFFTSFGPAFSDLEPSFFAVGNALQVSAMAGVYGVSQTIANERLFGAINNIFVTPAGRVALYAGRAIPHLVIGALTSVVGLVIAVAVTGMSAPVDRWGGLLPLVLVTTASCSAVGMLFGALGLMGRDTTITGNLAYFAILLLSGATVPLGQLPEPVAVLSHALPMTNGVSGLRHLLAVGPDGYFWSRLGWEAVVGLAWISLTMLLLRWIEQRARRGSLDFS